jgi:hypothetical protein
VRRDLTIPGKRKLGSFLLRCTRFIPQGFVLFARPLEGWATGG